MSSLVVPQPLARVCAGRQALGRGTHLCLAQLLPPRARSRGRARYYLPGGKREPGETDAQTLLRETREELAVALDPASLTCAGTFEAPAHGHPASVRVRMSCCWAPRYTGTIQTTATVRRYRPLASSSSTGSSTSSSWLRKRSAPYRLNLRGATRLWARF